MRVANCVNGSSVFAIYPALFFDPGGRAGPQPRRSQTARGLREDAGRTRRRRSVTEAGAPCRNHRLTKPERTNHTTAPNGDSRGSTSNVKRSSSRPSAKRQVISSGLTTSITIARLPVRRSTTISPRCGMDHLHRGGDAKRRHGHCSACGRNRRRHRHPSSSRSSRRRGGRGRPPLLCSFERLLCSRLRFEQLAPYVEKRPTDEDSSPEQDESSNDGHRDRYAGKLRDEAHAFTTNIAHGHGGLLKRRHDYL